MYAPLVSTSLRPPQSAHSGDVCLTVDMPERLSLIFCRTKLDILQRKMTILAPNQGFLVGKATIIGSYEWQDQ